MCVISAMQFHDYLESLLGSKVAIRIVRTLVRYQGKVFTVRKLAEAANVSSSEAALAVQQFEKFGVLGIQPVGRSYLLSLNHKSYVLNRILKPLIYSEERTLDELVSVIKRQFDKEESTVSVVLFGSVATRNERIDSDIDLLVVSNNLNVASGLAAKAKEQVSLIFNNRLSPLIMSEKELRAKKEERLMRSIVSSHIAVAGREIMEVISGR